MGQKGSASEFICRDHESTVCPRVADVSNFQVSTARCLTNRHAGALSPGTIFSRVRQDLLYLSLLDVMIPDVRLTCCWIEVEAKLHRHQYTNWQRAVQAAWAAASGGLTTRARRLSRRRLQRLR